MRLLSIIITTLTLSNVHCQLEETITVNITSDEIIPETYIIPKVTKPIKIDGKPEKAWENAPFTWPFVDIEGYKAPILGEERAIESTKTPKYKTQAKMMWDESYLYVYAELHEPHIWGDITERDAIIYLNNDFEVFIDPSTKTQVYAEIEINALNTVWDLLLDKPYRTGGFANFYWNLDDIKTAVKIHGTLNDSSDKDDKWTVEMAIPMKPLIELKKDKYQMPKEGEQWRMNFSRVNWDHDLVDGRYQRKRVDGVIQPEYNWVWSAQGAINMHMPENWGIVQFTEQSTTEGVTVISDPDLHLKQFMYAAYRSARWGYLKDKLPTQPGTSIHLDVVSSKGTLPAQFHKTHTGFEITFNSDHSGKEFVINYDGRLIEITLAEEKPFKLCTWAHPGKVFESSSWEQKLATYDSLGITDVLVGGSPEVLQQIVNLAAPKGISIHAWMWTLNRPNDTIANKHPEWYAVNRLGKNSLEYRAYVDYYQWLSPFHPAAREHVKRNVRRLMRVKGLASIHLDYVRYVDVILGADLQPKYDLVQDREMPEYDFGYHPIAREEFKALFGKDPIEMEHPELSTEWRQFRLNAITTLVNEIADEVHSRGYRLSAAVFPFPEMSRQMVRQAWNDWNLDYVYPMVYHNFYQENINWIGFATEQGVRDVDFPLFTGLYMPGFNSPEEFENAIQIARSKGASGVSLFTVDGMKPEYKEVLFRLKNGE